jgi:hypothetical protein
MHKGREEKSWIQDTDREMPTTRQHSSPVQGNSLSRFSSRENASFLILRAYSAKKLD